MRTIEANREEYEQLVERAVQDFSTDAGYTLAIAQAAADILTKRAARAEIEAEKKRRKLEDS